MRRGPGGALGPTRICPGQSRRAEKYRPLRAHLAEPMNRMLRHFLAILLPLSLPLMASIGHAASSANSIESRVAACIACHGRDGRAGLDAYYPRLAGKPEIYLFNQLVSFRDGRRFNSSMVHLVQHMSDSYLSEIAAYFSGLDLPYPSGSEVTDASASTLARGQTLVQQGDGPRGIPACTACHGVGLTGVLPAVPPLVGLPRLYLSSQLGAWLTDERHSLPPDCMAQVGRRLTTIDINAIASWLALQPVPADARPISALPHAPPLPCSALPQ